MTLRRLIANLAVAIVLAALVVLVIFAHLSTRVKPERSGVIIEQNVPSGGAK